MGRTEPPAQGCDLEAQDESFLVLRARTGDTQAFDELLRRNLPGIYRLCAGMLGAGDDAQDATQETFVRAWQNLRRYDPSRPFGPWLRGIAMKVCQQGLRRRSGELQRLTPLSGREAEHLPRPVDPPMPLADEVIAALAELDESYRQPLILFYLHDASVAEVAQTLGISPGATRVRLHRGREMLRDKLQKRRDAQA